MSSLRIEASLTEYRGLLTWVHTWPQRSWGWRTPTDWTDT
jgi:hypothetical protein